MLLNPDQELKKDQIKVMLHIDSMTSQNQYMRIKSIKAYKRANLEGQKMLRENKRNSLFS